MNLKRRFKLWFAQVRHHLNELKINFYFEDFEDSSVPQEKFFSYMPVAMDILPSFTLLDARYWENNDQVEHSAFAMPQTKTQFQELQAVETTMKIFK